MSNPNPKEREMPLSSKAERILELVYRMTYEQKLRLIEAVKIAPDLPQAVKDLIVSAILKDLK